MGATALKDARAGMVLVCDACSPDGRKLYPSGTVLDEDKLRTLETWGVLQVHIDARQTDGDDMELSPESMDKARSIVDERFSLNHCGSPLMSELRRLSLADTISRMRLNKCLPAPPEVDLSSTEYSPLRDLFLSGDGTADDLAEREVELSSLPDIYYRIRDVLESPSSSAAQISEVVSGDVNLCAKLLRIVNSPLYGLPGKVDSVERAVAIVGTRELSTLALGISVTTCFQGVPDQLVDMASFWKHSTACGLFCRTLAERAKMPGPERFFVAGLLHDIGRLVMLKELPYASSQAMVLAREHGTSLVHAEMAVLDFDHAQVAEKLITKWNFPLSLEGMISGHHNPMSCPMFREASVVHVADLMAIATNFGCGGTWFIPQLASGAWESLNLPPGDVELMTKWVRGQFAELVQVFFQEPEK